MPVYRKCSFCGSDVEPGTGILLVRNDGSMLWFCGSKCRKNMLKLRRSPRTLKWVLRAAKKS